MQCIKCHFMRGRGYASLQVTLLILLLSIQNQVDPSFPTMTTRDASQWPSSSSIGILPGSRFSPIRAQNSRMHSKYTHIRLSWHTHTVLYASTTHHYLITYVHMYLSQLGMLCLQNISVLFMCTHCNCVNNNQTRVHIHHFSFGWANKNLTQAKRTWVIDAHSVMSNCTLGLM